MELSMQNLDAKKLALMALRKKLRQLEMATEGETSEQEENMSDLSTDEKGYSNQVEDAREEADTMAAAEGEDGEKEVSVEMEIEGDTGGMEALYKRMREDFGSEPESRKATGKKVSMRGGMSGMGAMKQAMIMGKKKK
jgi:hypothetical protein